MRAADPRFVFEDIYERIRRRGRFICPGKLALALSFCIGCIGSPGPEETRGALATVEGSLERTGGRERCPLRDNGPPCEQHA